MPLPSGKVRGRFQSDQLLGDSLSRNLCAAIVEMNDIVE